MNGGDIRYIRSDFIGNLTLYLNNNRTESYVIFTGNYSKMKNKKNHDIIFHRTKDRIVGYINEGRVG